MALGAIASADVVGFIAKELRERRRAGGTAK
jgi:hypothetical protein